MNLTAKLKNWAVENGLAKAADTDDTFKQAIAGALMTGKLKAAKLEELSLEEKDVAAGDMKTLMGNLVKSLGDMNELLKAEKAAPPAPPVAPPVPPKADADDTDDEEEAEKKKSAKLAKEKSQPDQLEKMVMGVALANTGMSFDGEKSLMVRVKEAAEGYSTTKSAAIFPSRNEKGASHPLAGQRMTYNGRPLDNASEQDQAVSGAYAKFIVQAGRLRSKNAAFASLQQHDRELLLFAMHKMPWGGSTDGGDEENIKSRLLTPHEQKAIIDDATSGGIEAAPIVFDDQVIMTPLLNGELFPLVHTIPIDRGRRIEAVAVSNVTSSWGGVDDTSISLFNTASYVSAFDTTIHRWEGAIQLGLDFLSDTPIDFNSIITKQYGERLLEDLDDVISTGNGTTQPEGVFVKSGTTSVNFGSSAATLGGYESLRFGVAKAEHKSAGNSAVFIGSETSYQRAKAIPVGASDARRLSDTQNMPNYDGYSWMNRPFKINESGGNTKIGYGIMNKYRMYRRRGLAMRTSDQGDTLLRKNLLLMIAMARYGGHAERGACFAVTTSALA